MSVKLLKYLFFLYKLLVIYEANLENFSFKRLTKKSFFSLSVFQLNWVCDETVNLAIGQSLFYVGSVFGTLLFGYLADKYGRLPTMILSNLSGAVGDFATSFTYNLTQFAVCRFVSGLATDTCFYLMYIMGNIFQ